MAKRREYVNVKRYLVSEEIFLYVFSPGTRVFVCAFVRVSECEHVYIRIRTRMYYIRVYIYMCSV